MSGHEKKPSAFAARGGGVLGSQAQRLAAQRASDAALQRARGGTAASGGGAAGVARSSGAGNLGLARAMRLGLPIATREGAPSPRGERTPRSLTSPRADGRPNDLRASAQPAAAEQGGRVGARPLPIPTSDRGRPKQAVPKGGRIAAPAARSAGEATVAQPHLARQSQAGKAPVAEIQTAQEPDREARPGPSFAAPGPGFYQASHGVPSPAFGRSQHFKAPTAQLMPSSGNGVATFGAPFAAGVSTAPRGGTPGAFGSAARPLFGQSALEGDAKASNATDPFAVLASQASNVGSAWGSGFGTGGTGPPGAAFSGVGLAQTGSRPLIGSIPRTSNPVGGDFQFGSSIYSQADTPAPFVPFGNHLGAVPSVGVTATSAEKGALGETSFAALPRPLVGTVEGQPPDTVAASSMPAVGTLEEGRVIRGRGDKMGTEGTLGRPFLSGTTGGSDSAGGGAFRSTLTWQSRLNVLPTADDSDAGPTGDEGKQDGRAGRAAPLAAAAASAPVTKTRLAVPVPVPVPGKVMMDQARLNQRANRFSATLQPVTTGSAPTPSNAAQVVEAVTAVSYTPMMDDDDAGEFQGTTVGTCELMCPVEDRERRERTENISMFERPDPRVAKSSPDLAVKPFQRTVDTGPENFRTMAALQRTQSHLRAIMDRTDVPLVEIHKFLWDRYRGIRQDLFVQGFKDKVAVAMIEEHIRFMILAQYELSEVGEGIADKEAFNAHLNIEQVNKAIVTLCAVYDEAAEAGEPYPTEAEIRSYNLLLIMGTHGKYAHNNAAFTSCLLELRQEVLEDSHIVRALGLHEALRNNNWIRFFQLAAEAPYLQACLAHVHFPSARATALRLLSASQNNEAVPLSFLASRLLFSSEAAAALFFQAVGLDIDNYSVVIPRGFQISHKDVPQSRTEVITRKAAPRRSLDALGGKVAGGWVQTAPLPLPQPLPVVRPVQEIAPAAPFSAAPAVAATPAIGIAPAAFVPPAFGSANQQTLLTHSFARPPVPAFSETFSTPPTVARPPSWSVSASVPAVQPSLLPPRPLAPSLAQQVAEEEARRTQDAAEKARREAEQRARQQLEEEERARAEWQRKEAERREQLRLAREAALEAQRLEREEAARALERRLREEEAAEAARRAAEAEAERRRRERLEAIQRRAAEEAHQKKVAAFVEKRTERVRRERESRLKQRAIAWADRARSVVALRNSLRNLSVGIRWGSHLVVPRGPSHPSSSRIAAAIREGSTHRLQYGEQLAASEVLNLAEAVGTSFASRTPEASVAFCKWVLLFPPDSDSLLLRDCLLGPRGARSDAAGELLQTSAAKVVNSSGRTCQVLVTVRNATPLCFMPAAAQQAGLEKAMEAATGVLLHIPSRRTPDLTSVVASFASMLRSCSPASPPLPVLLLTHPSIASTLAHPLSQLLTGQADLLSAIPPASADGSLDGPHAWDLVPGKAVRLAAVPLEEARAGREGLIQSLNWLAATSCPPPPLQAKPWSQIVEGVVWRGLEKLDGDLAASPQQWLAAYERGLDAALHLLDNSSFFEPSPDFWSPDEGEVASFVRGGRGGTLWEACRGAADSLRMPPFPAVHMASPGTQETEVTGAVLRYLETAGVRVSGTEQRAWRSELCNALLGRLGSLAQQGLPSILLPHQDLSPRQPLRLLLGGLNTRAAVGEALSRGGERSSPTASPTMGTWVSTTSKAEPGSVKRKAVKLAEGQSPSKTVRVLEAAFPSWAPASPAPPYPPASPPANEWPAGEAGGRRVSAKVQSLLQKVQAAKREAAAFTARLSALAGEGPGPPPAIPQDLPPLEAGGSELVRKADRELAAWSLQLHNLRLAERGLP